MKDIGNYKLVHVHEAVQRLDRAMTRLERAAAQVQPTAPLEHAKAELQQELARLQRDHATLKDTAGQVALRLDTAISRLSASLENGGQS